MAKRAEQWGGPPATLPASLDDVEAILKRWTEILRYDPKTGALLRRYLVDQRDAMTVYESLIATKRKANGNMLTQDGLTVGAERVVWLLHHGAWPSGPLGRRDGDIHNDRLENLYLSDEVQHEPKARGRKRFRPLGVTRFYDRWRAYVGEGANRRIIGVYKTQEAAAEARRRWDDAADLV